MSNSSRLHCSLTNNRIQQESQLFNTLNTYTAQDTFISKNSILTELSTNIQQQYPKELMPPPAPQQLKDWQNRIVCDERGRTSAFIPFYSKHLATKRPSGGALTDYLTGSEADIQEYMSGTIPK